MLSFQKVGKELLEDPEYLRRLEAGMIDTKHVELNDVKNMFHARISVIIFIAATLLIVLFGSIPRYASCVQRCGFGYAFYY